MIDIHIFVPELQHLNPLGIKGCCHLHGDQKIGTAQGTNPLEQLRGGTAAIFQAAAVLIGAGVVFTHITDGGDLHHIKAEAAIFQRIVGDVLNPVLQLVSGGHALFTAAAGTAAHAAHTAGGHAGTPICADSMVFRTVSAHAGRRSAGTARTEGAKSAAGLRLREAQTIGHPTVALHET